MGVLDVLYVWECIIECPRIIECHYYDGFKENVYNHYVALISD